MHAFILAGGFATRLWPLTEKRAKPLLPLAGVPLIEYLVADIPKDIPITISTNAVFKEAFEEWAQGFGRANVEILIEDVQSDDQKLGALGATAQWITQAKIDDDVLLLTGDNYCGFSFEDFLDQASDDTTLIAVHDIGNIELAKAFGTVIADGKIVNAFEEKPKEPKTTLVNTGCSLLPKSVLLILVEHAKKHPDNVGGVFEELLNRGKSIECFTFSEPWFDIGSFDAYLGATRALKGDDFVVIGDRSTVDKASELKNVVIFEDCVIEDCVLSNCVLDKHCTLKGVELHGKMLREGTKLERE